MKFKDHKLQLTVLILLFLPLFGWGCAKESTVSNQSETGQDTVASVDTSVSIDATKPTDISTPDTLKPIDTTAKDTVKDVSNVPEGWKVWKIGNVSIAAPAVWKSTKQGIYRWHAGIEEEFTQQDHFDDISRLSKVAIGILVEENQPPKTINDLWQEYKVDNSIDNWVTVGGEQARVANCSGINYTECAITIHDGKMVIFSISYMQLEEALKTEVSNILQYVAFGW